MDRLSRWLAGEGLVVSVLDEQVVTHFLAVTEWDRQRVPTLQDVPAAAGMVASKGWLGRLRCQCCQPLMSYWLVTGLAGTCPGTVAAHGEPLCGHRRRFLAARAGRRRAERGRGAERARRKPFLLAERHRGLSVGSMKGRVAELCSLLRFLHSEGISKQTWRGGAAVAGWRDSEIAPMLSPLRCRPCSTAATGHP